MTDDPTINQQIAALFQQQTYADRMEMGRYFRDVVVDANADRTPLDDDWFASAFEAWAEAELDDAEATS